jgi:hypothetical protein
VDVSELKKNSGDTGVACGDDQSASHIRNIEAAREFEEAMTNLEDRKLLALCMEREADPDHKGFN